MIENFGQYQLLEKIAEGGMAEIYLAKSSKFQGLEKYLVIKRILPQYSNSSELIKMFINEAKINMNMSHSNIVSIFDFGIESGRFFIAMEHVQGQNLRGLVRTMRFSKGAGLSLPEKIYVVAQAALGLGYAHRCAEISTGNPLNIVHRDVSPDNIMINVEGNVKIIDFGVAVDSENTERSTQEGKFSYMSPEQANELSPITAQTDVFSLGVVLWELFAEEKMYQGGSNFEILSLAKECKHKNIKDYNDLISDELEKIVRRSLSKNREDRYKDMNEFYIDLNKYLNINYPDFTVQSLKEKVKIIYDEESTQIQQVMTNFRTRVQSTFNAVDEKTQITQIKSRRKISGRIITKKKKRIKKAS